MPNNPALSGRVVQEFVDVDPSINNTSIPDVVGHGTWVAEIAAGAPFGQFAGGIAPGASLVSACIIDDNGPDDNGFTQPAVVTAADATPLGQVNLQLISAGVNVMNNSWGGITWSSLDTGTTQAFDAAYTPFVEAHDGLVVFAAGNDSQANPSTIAMLPTVANDAALQQGAVPVVSLSSGSCSVAYGESGYRLNLGAVRLTPYANLQYAQIWGDGFDELGADGFGLQAPGHTVSRWQAGAGLHADRQWSFNARSTLQLDYERQSGQNGFARTISANVHWAL
jgi:hypothetical protein